MKHLETRARLFAVPRTRNKSKIRWFCIKERLKPLSEPLHVPRLTFPHHEHPPTVTPKGTHGPFITSDVRRKLGAPELGPRGWFDASVAASVSVPEAPVNEHGHTMHRKHDVRASRQVPALKSEAVAHRVEKPSNGQLRRGVASLDRPHVAGTLLGGQHVGHGSRHNRLRVLQEVRHVVNLEFPIRRVFLVKPLRNDERHPGLPHLLHLVR